MSRERQTGPTPTEGDEGIDNLDIGIGIGAAVGLVLAAIPIIEKLDQQYAGSIEMLLGRLTIGVVISLGGTGVIHLSNHIRNRQ